MFFEILSRALFFFSAKIICSRKSHKPTIPRLRWQVGEFTWLQWLKQTRTFLCPVLVLSTIQNVPVRIKLKIFPQLIYKESKLGPSQLALVRTSELPMTSTFYWFTKPILQIYWTYLCKNAFILIYLSNSLILLSEYLWNWFILPYSVQTAYITP